MNKKPSLQEFLRDNPAKGMNDYFLKYGQPEDSMAAAPIQEEASIAEQPKSYIQPKQSDKSKIDVLNIISSVAIIAGFFLPWLSLEGFKGAEKHAIFSGLDMYSLFDSFKFEAFSDQSYYTIYLIPLGAIIALAGELLRNWAVRIMGQILSICFGVFWLYKFYYLYEKTELRPEDIGLMDFVQYGYLIVLSGVILYFVDIIRATFGTPR